METEQKQQQQKTNPCSKWNSLISRVRARSQVESILILFFFFGFSLYKYFFAVDKLIYISTYDPKEAE